MNRIIIIADYRYSSYHDDVKNEPLRKSGKLVDHELIVDNRFYGLDDLADIVYEDNIDFISSREKSIGMTSLNGAFLFDYLKKWIPENDVVLITEFNRSKEILALLLHESPFAVIISTTFLGLPELMHIVQYIKEHCGAELPHIIIGGQSIYQRIYYEPALLKFYRNSFKDTLFIVEKYGEKSLIVLLKLLAADTSGTICETIVEKAENVVYIDSNGVCFHSKTKVERSDINDMVINWSDIPEESILPVLSVNTSYGCPYRCSFCNFWTFHPTVAFKEITLLETELKKVKQLNKVKHIVVADDLLNFSKKRIVEFCTILIKNKINIGWSANLRVSPIDEEIVANLKEAHCQMVSFGIESFDPTVLENMNKKITVKQIIDSIRCVKSAGIGVNGSFVFGFPGETESSLNRTVDLINETDIDFPEIFPFIYYKNAVIHSRASEFRLQGSEYKWKHYTMDSENLHGNIMPEALKKLKRSGSINRAARQDVSRLLASGLDITKIRELYDYRTHLVKKYMGKRDGKPTVNNIKDEFTVFMTDKYTDSYNTENVVIS